MLWKKQKQRGFLIKMEGIDLSDFFQTKSQANDFLTHISEISESIYETSFDFEQELSKHFGIKKKDKLISLLRDNKVNIYSHDELKNFLEKVQERISKLPLLSLTIAFEPNEETLKMFSEWLVLNLHKEVLLDISIDTSLIAGVKISFNGKYIDRSIKTRFDQIFQNVVINKSQATNIVIPQQNNQNTQHVVER